VIVLLLPVGRTRYELYSEPVEPPSTHDIEGEGRLRRWMRAAREGWRTLEESARQNAAPGRIARWRDRLVRNLSDTLAEQRTVWTLGEVAHATLLYPPTLDEDAARRTRDDILVSSRRRHLVWMLVHGSLFLMSVVLAPIPGPNIVAYYVAFRAFGHLQSWRGARHGLSGVTWTLRPDDALSELAALVDLPRTVRHSRVEAIAARLNLPRLCAFFERVAA